MMSTDKPASSKVKDQQQESIDKQEVYRRIYRRLPDLMNVRVLYNEIYYLKTAIQLLYTPEQYAAIKFLGRKLYDPSGIENIDNVRRKMKAITPLRYRASTMRAGSI